MLQVNTNGHTPSIVMLLFGDQTGRLYDLSTRLNNLHYDATLAHNLDDAWGLLSTRQPDAIVAGDNETSLELYSAICERVESPFRPLLILVCDAPPAQMPDFSEPVLIIPASFEYLEHQLRAFLGLRTANRQLHRSNDSLIQENRRLKAALDLQNSRDDEITLLKNAIVRNVSHELRTPLLQIKSAVSLLTEDVGRDNKLIEYATNATARLEAGVRNVTLLNELMNESMEIHSPGPVLVSEITDYAIRNLRRSWEHKDQIERIQVKLAAQLPLVQADKQGLAIVLQLLLDNALKFSEQMVEVRAYQQQNHVTLTIKDLGIGIPADQLDKIFDPFYQIDNSNTRRYSGMGIGLAIVRFILERHQTKVTVESREGVGSTFIFSLPVAELH